MIQVSRTFGAHTLSFPVGMNQGGTCRLEDSPSNFHMIPISHGIWRSLELVHSHQRTKEQGTPSYVLLHLKFCCIGRVSSGMLLNLWQAQHLNRPKVELEPFLLSPIKDCVSRGSFVSIATRFFADRPISLWRGSVRSHMFKTKAIGARTRVQGRPWCWC